jgi:putative sigma-54 modulation protein
VRIDLSCDDANSTHGLREYATDRMRAAIGRFRDHIQWARVKVANVRDSNGSHDKRCVVQLRLRNLPDVVFAITQIEARAAVDEAANRLARVLAQRIRRHRPENHPRLSALPA